MQYAALLFDYDNGIVTLTINRESALNALNAQVFADLQQFFSQDFRQVEGLKGVVITGAGAKAFAAGADIKEFEAFKTADDAAAKSQLGQNIFLLIEQFHCPVIAAVNGFALGGGCELAMACHLRVASPNAKFGQPEVNLGIIPGYGGTQRLIQLIGKAKAMELLLTADMIGATEAQQLGLVNHVVEIGETVEKAKSIIAKISTKAPLAITQIIESVNAYFDKNIDGFAYEVHSFGKTSESEDFKEGASAFMEKRAAKFVGK